MRIGTLAVDRRMRIKRVVLGDSNPQVADHDFPVPSYLLSLSGYEELIGINSESRGHFILPKFESLHIRAKVFRYISSSAALHAFNMETILAEKVFQKKHQDQLHNLRLLTLFLHGEITSQQNLVFLLSSKVN